MQTVMITVSQSTLAKIDAIEVDQVDAGAKAADLRGEKVTALVNQKDDKNDLKLELQRLQLQAASMKKEWADSVSKSDELDKKATSALSAVEGLQEKLSKAKELADSRNNIIRAFKSIVDEVGF